jgi:hypothetical protein
VYQFGINKRIILRCTANQISNKKKKRKEKKRKEKKKNVSFNILLVLNVEVIVF